MLDLEIDQLNKTLKRKETLIESKNKQLETQAAILTEHELCIKNEEKMQKQAAKLTKENEDLHVWVERETHRAAEQQM